MQCATDGAYYTQMLAALALIVVLALVLERALSVPFEWGAISEYLDRFKLRAPIAFGVAYLICWHAKFDLLPRLLTCPGSQNEMPLSSARETCGAKIRRATVAHALICEPPKFRQSRRICSLPSQSPLPC